MSAEESQRQWSRKAPQSPAQPPLEGGGSGGGEGGGGGESEGELAAARHSCRGIDVLPASALTTARFASAYVARNRPLLVLGALTQDGSWDRARTAWSDFGSLARKLSAVSVNAGSIPYPAKFGLQDEPMQMADYLRQSEASPAARGGGGSASLRYVFEQVDANAVNSSALGRGTYIML